MVTEEEKEEIINAAVERAMLALPEVVGSMLMTQLTLAKVNKDLYKAHPELRDKKDIVASVVEATEGEHPLLDYEEIIEKALPKIKERVKLVSGLNLESISKPDRSYSDLGDDQ